MRTKLLFDNVDAGVAQTSEEINFDYQDGRFLIQALKTGTDGSPKVIVEESIDGSVWTILEDTETWENYSLIQDNEVLGIKDNYVMGNFLRVRLEPNGTTTGTVWLKIGYKTKV